MSRTRYRRLLASFASLMWLVTGVTDAAGLSVCTYHGHTELHGVSGHGGHDSAEGVSHSPEPAHHAHPDHDPAAHGSSSGVETRAESAHGEDLVCSADEAPAEHGCDCRSMCCMGAGNPSPIQVSVSEIPHSSPEMPEPPQPASVGAQLSFHLVPFLLPPAEAPPAS